MPIFRAKSVKIYTGQKNLHGYIRGIRDKYQVWLRHVPPHTIGVEITINFILSVLLFLLPLILFGHNSNS